MNAIKIKKTIKDQLKRPNKIQNEIFIFFTNSNFLNRLNLYLTRIKTLSTQGTVNTNNSKLFILIFY